MEKTQNWHVSVCTISILRHARLCYESQLNFSATFKLQKEKRNIQIQAEISIELF